MAQSYRSRYLAVHRSNEQALHSLYVALARDIAAEVTKRADRDGNVPRSAAFELQRAIADRVQAMFLGRDRDGKLAPYTLFPGGAVVPLSPFMRQLWDSIKAAIRIPVEQNAVILANKLPADVLYVMARATRNPFVAAGRVAELFRPDPFAVYAAPHEWVDPNGYRLSDRVWNVAAETRRQIDAYVEDSLRRGIGALEMSRGLRQFLTPGEQLRTTTKPYSRTASYSGMRLARTEITRAHNQAHRLAAAMNPFVNGLKWNLSARHPRYDICDEYARGGPGGDGVYEVEAYPEIPHPHCVTPGQMVMTTRGNVPIEAVEAGDLVLTHMGRYRPVLAAWSTPHDNLVYKFQTRLGKVEVTGNHPVLLRSGWRYAEFVKPGDEILYAGVNIGFDLLVSEADCLPSSFEQGSITHSVTVGLPLMPVDAIALNSNLGFDQGKVKDVASNLVLGVGKDSMPLESLVHNDFDISGAVASENTLLGAKDTAIGLATLDHELPLTSLAGDSNTGGSVHLGNGNLSGNVGALGGVIVSSEIESSTGESHLFTGGNAPTPVVFFPTGGDSIAHAPHGDIVGGEQVTQDSIGDAILSKDLSARHAFFGVDFGEQDGDRAAILIFEPHGVKGGRWDVVSLPMPFEVRQRHPADGASNHYSLLSLSPDKRRGAGSGNPDVRGVITPSLAPLQYSTVLAVSTCQYTGKVYNMEVADDHSYTVNGAAVHNCLCYPSNVMISSEESASIIDQLRADIQSTRQKFVDLVGPLRVEAFEKLLFGEGLEVVSIPGQASRFIKPAITPPAAPLPAPAPAPVIEPTPVVEPPPPVIVEPPPVATPPVVEPVIAPPALVQRYEYLPSDRQIERVESQVDRYVLQVARAKRVSIEQVEQAAADAINDIVSHDLSIQFKSENLDTFLSDPRLKSQFETGRSGGALSHELRADAEYSGLGAPLELDPRRRPIYGYVNLGPAAQKRVGQYGDITFVLKDTVRERTTVTVGDSLYNMRTGYVAGTPVSQPGKASWDTGVDALFEYAKDKDSLALINKISYAEIQIQNGVGIDDIRAVIDRTGALTQAQRRRLKDLGVEVWDK